MKSIMRYMKFIKFKCMCYGSQILSTKGYTKLDCVRDLDKRRSTLGHVFMWHRVMAILIIKLCYVVYYGSWLCCSTKGLQQIIFMGITFLLKCWELCLSKVLYGTKENMLCYTYSVCRSLQFIARVCVYIRTWERGE